MKKYKVKVNGKVYEVEVEAVEEVNGSIAASEAKKETVVNSDVKGSHEIIAPIAGKVISLKVNAGDYVKVNQTVAVIEAMKLENEIQSPFEGKVAAIRVSEGTNVRNKDVLIVLE